MKTVQPIENERKSNQPMNDWIPLVLHENQVCFLIELDRFSSSFQHQKKKWNRRKKKLIEPHLEILWIAVSDWVSQMNLMKNIDRAI
jgi:hypothetical protein